MPKNFRKLYQNRYLMEMRRLDKFQKTIEEEKADRHCDWCFKAMPQDIQRRQRRQYCGDVCMDRASISRFHTRRYEARIENKNTVNSYLRCPAKGCLIADVGSGADRRLKNHIERRHPYYKEYMKRRKEG